MFRRFVPLRGNVRRRLLDDGLYLRRRLRIRLRCHRLKVLPAVGAEPGHAVENLVTVRTETLGWGRARQWAGRGQRIKDIRNGPGVVDILCIAESEPKVLVVEQPEVKAACRLAAEGLDIAERYRVHLA